MRIIFIPQYPVPNRYSEWWIWKFPKEFKKAGFEVITLGEEYSKTINKERGDNSLFSPVNTAIDFELQQMKEYMKLELRNNDVLFLSDISFPGGICSLFYHKRPKKCYAFCHATSLNKYDIFEDVAISKYPVEWGNAKLFNKIFVGSEYHKDKLKWDNTVVTYLPEPDHISVVSKPKIYDIVSASRPGKQKVDSELEAKVEANFGPIIRKETKTAEEYYEFLSKSKVLLSTAFEDTFGYQIIDAINNNCIPVARNGLAYPEIIPREYLYDNQEELFNILERALWGLMSVPKVKCKQQMKDFYRTIIKEMTD